MMKKPKDGGPAFPGGSMTELEDRGSAWGMSLRDYFAAAALQGMLADSENCATANSNATSAYAFADAMLVERKREAK